MSIEIHNVGALRVLSESTFASDGTGTLGNYTYVPFNEGTGTMTLTTDSLDPQFAVQSRIEGRKDVLGKRSATLQFTMNLAPTGTAADDGNSAVQGALGLILKAVMGGQKLGTGTTFTGGTATQPTVTSAAGFEAGAAIGWVNGNGVLEVREIESISSGTITLKLGFSAAPSNGEDAIAAATYYLTENPSESLQFLVEGVESQDRWLLLGGQCVGGMTLNLDPSGASIPTVQFSLTFADYKTSSETAGSITGTLSAASYSNYEPIVGHVGELRCVTVGAATLTTSSVVHCSALAFTPKIAYVPVPSPSGTNGIYRWRAGRANPPAEGTFTTFFEDLTYWTARDNRTDKAIFYTMGTTAGEALLISEPTVQIKNPQRAAADEIAGQTISFSGRRDTDVGASTTEIAKSPFRIHLV